MNGTEEHIPYMVKFGLAIAIRVKNTVINHPKLISNRIEIDAVDYANTFDNAMLIARILPSNALNFSRMNLFQNDIIKDDIAFDGAAL